MTIATTVMEVTWYSSIIQKKWTRNQFHFSATISLGHSQRTHSEQNDAKQLSQNSVVDFSFKLEWNSEHTVLLFTILPEAVLGGAGSGQMSLKLLLVVSSKRSVIFLTRILIQMIWAGDGLDMNIIMFRERARLESAKATFSIVSMIWSNIWNMLIGIIELEHCMWWQTQSNLRTPLRIGRNMT